jgi:hypothetical protein
MNKLSKDLLFYSNYCLHSNNLINTISKTSIHNEILYICIDEKKVKVPSFINRVPTIYLSQEKKILVEDDIDRWFEQKNRQNQQEQERQKQMHQASQQQGGQQKGGQQQVGQQQGGQQQTQKNQDEGIMAYHGNEMGSSMSNNYSFLEENNNSSLNHNFEFLDVSNSTRINTPKEFNKNNSGPKTQLDSDFDKLMASRNNESFSKGIERV